MKTLLAVVALMAGLAVYSAIPAAEDKAEQKGVEGLHAWVQDLTLTDDQETKIADVRKEYHPKVVEAAREVATLVKEEVAKVRDVLTEEQKEKLKTLKESRKEHREHCLPHMIARLKELDLTDDEMTKIGEIRNEFRPRFKKALEGLKGTLNDEQMKAREDGLKDGKKRKEILASLKLTDEQKAKVQAVGKEIRTLVHEEMEKIKDVLSEGQKEKLQEFKEERREHVRDRMAHHIAHHKDLDLTEEQKTRIREIRKEFRPKIHEAGNKLRATLREEVHEILGVLKG